MKRYLLDNKREYQICTNCVMDTTDSKIQFDKNGRCDFCNDYYENILPNWHPANSLTDCDDLMRMANEIKKRSKNKKYDCIIGLSGGVDSSYLCYIAKEIMHLNPLAFVVDTGWNLDVANKNIKTITEKLGIDVHWEKINWSEMRDLQVAFLKSGVPYQDLPQDHAIFASLYNYAVKNKINCVLTGANNATECIRPPIEWVYQNDIRFIKDVHKKYGEMKLKTFPFCGMLKYRLAYPIFKKMKRYAPLNLIPYDKNRIKSFLINNLNWSPYENKHFEDRFTRWYEGFYLINKFGFDKRKCYLSNLILTGEINREDALNQLSIPPYSQELIMEDTIFIAEKLGLTQKQLITYVENENKSFEDFKNSFRFISFCTKVLRLVGKENKRFR